MKIILIPNFFANGEINKSYHVVLQLIDRYDSTSHGALSIFDWEARWTTFCQNQTYSDKEKNLSFFTKLHELLLFIPQKRRVDSDLVFVVNFDYVDLGEIVSALRLANPDMDAVVVLGQAEFTKIESELWVPDIKLLAHDGDIVPAVSGQVSLKEKVTIGI